MGEEQLLKFLEGDVISYDKTGSAWKLNKKGKEVLIAAVKKYANNVHEPHFSHTVSEAE